jgi:hypothetical protein
MIKAIRYTLAAICLAASVGCLALWWRSYGTGNSVQIPNGINPGPDSELIFVTTFRGRGNIATGTNNLLVGFPSPPVEWDFTSTALDKFPESLGMDRYRDDHFGRIPNGVFFPLCYPALVFAIAAIAAIRIGRFTLRSALVGMSVVAALLGIAVAL